MYFPAPSPPLHGKTGSTKCCLQRQTGPGDVEVVVVVILMVVVVLGDDDASRESCLTWQADPRQGLPAAADLARKFLPTEITAGPMRGNQHVQGQMDMWRNPQGGQKQKGFQKLYNNDWNKDVNK